MSGFGPFRPIVVFPAGWYFEPVLIKLGAQAPSRDMKYRFGSSLRKPVVVQPRGWDFKREPVVMMRRRALADPRRRTYGKYSAAFVVQEAGWYFKPIRVIPRTSAFYARGVHRRTDVLAILKRPIVVQREGWYFDPIQVTAAAVKVREFQRRADVRAFPVVTKAVIPTNTVAPVASGTAQDGQLLSTTNGTWTGTATVTVGSAYQWQTASDVGFTTSVSDIGGAAASTYLLTAAEIGLFVRCIVSATNVAAIGLGYSNVLGPVIP